MIKEKEVRGGVLDLSSFTEAWLCLFDRCKNGNMGCRELGQPVPLWGLKRHRTRVQSGSELAQAVRSELEVEVVQLAVFGSDPTWIGTCGEDTQWLELVPDSNII